MKVFIAIFLCVSVNCLVPPPSLKGSLYQSSLYQKSRWKTIFVNQTLDHFNLDSSSQFHTFQQRILINTESWKEGGAVLFYTGNEGDIELFAQNTGFIFEIAPALDAAVVYAEHRYYGKSMPFGKESLSDWTKSRFFTTEQAMADFAENVNWLKTSYLKSSDAPVIAFGGSYGGMLAAWMRMKYPSLIQGAIAASAPVWSFPGMAADLSLPYKIITKSFARDFPSCPVKISKSWDMIRQYGKSETGRNHLQKVFHTCTPVSDEAHSETLFNWFYAAYFDLGMVNYPYPTQFLADLPAWPVKEFCRKTENSDDPLEAIYLGAQVYFNYTGKAECLNYDKKEESGLGLQGWYYQACTELIQPMSNDPDMDMFPAFAFDMDQYLEYCRERWGVEPKPYWLKHSLGGLNGFDYSGYSRIFFSNGDLDPWNALGTGRAKSPFCLDDCPNVVIKDGAHHLDIRASNPADPESVKEARTLEVEAIRRWIAQHSQQVKNRKIEEMEYDIGYYKATF